MKTIFIKPRDAHVKLWDPETGKFLPETGAKVKKTQYWGRRIADRDAVIVEPEKAEGKKPAPPPPPPPPPPEEMLKESEAPPELEKPKKKKGKK